MTVVAVPRSSRSPNSDVPSVYGLRMKQLREELGLSQVEVADLYGVRSTTISSWERGRFQGNTPQAAELPRRIIQGLLKRQRRHQRRNGQT